MLLTGRSYIAEIEAAGGAPADVAMDVGDLGALSLGAHPVGAAVASGRVEVSSPAALRTLQRLLTSERAPVSRTPF